MQKSLFSKDYETFVRMLRELREAAGITQAELAERLEAPQSFVSKCESGQRRLDVLEVRQWCRALEADFVRFMRQLERQLGAG